MSDHEDVTRDEVAAWGRDPGLCVHNAHARILWAVDSLIAAGASREAAAVVTTVIRCCLRTWASALGFASSGQTGSIDDLVRSLRHEMDPELYVALKRVSFGEWDVARPIDVARQLVDVVYGSPDLSGGWPLLSPRRPLP